MGEASALVPRVLKEKPVLLATSHPLLPNLGEQHQGPGGTVLGRDSNPIRLVKAPYERLSGRVIAQAPAEQVLHLAPFLK